MLEGSASGNVNPGAEALTVQELSCWSPDIVTVLRQMGVDVDGHEGESLDLLCDRAGLEPGDVFHALSTGAAMVEAEETQVENLTVVSGKDKKGNREPIDELSVEMGEIVALVGPTGSGKTQILSDIESLAFGDSPSRRKVLFDGVEPAEELRWSRAGRPIAQISQNMSFLLDLTVGEFLEMHIASRPTDDTPTLKKRVVDAACTLCGEPFGLEHQIVSLSGGQSRTLMIADAVLVSRTPILLIDEIENAGIDREKAMELLVGEGKISVIATHDPLLALRADRRVVLENGAMKEVIHRSDEDLEVLSWLEAREAEYVRIRERLRFGEPITLP